MTISVNNKPLELGFPNNISLVLHNLQFNQAKGLAIAVNNQVIPKSTWDFYELKENDKVTIIRATQGG